jgi:hypothetical protein
MLHSVKMKGDVTIVNVLKRDFAMIVGLRKTDDAPMTTEGFATTKNKRSHLRHFKHLQRKRSANQEAK